MRNRRRLLIAVLACGALAVAIVVAVGMRLPFSSDALRRRVVSTLSDKLDATVELDGLTLQLFPRMQATGTGLVVRHRSAAAGPPLISVGRFIVDADLVGLWRRRIARVRLDKLAINIPPEREPRDSGPPSDYARDLVVEELRADDATLVILRSEADKPPRTWRMHRLRMREVGLSTKMPFDTELTNAVPPGRIEATGTFGPWARETPGRTPVDGRFTFAEADLGHFKGIAGTLSAKGRFGGVLERLEVDGETDTPNFMVRLSGQEVPLRTRYHAVVDATNGNTTLDPVEALVLDTPITARGGVYEVEDVEGRVVKLDVTIDGGRLEDVMRMAVAAQQPPMTGGLTLATSLTIPPGDRDVVDKLELDGHFAISRGRFSDRGVQTKINDLSRRARGVRASDARASRVASDFKGRFRLSNGRLSLRALTFGVPGAVVELNGTYALRRGSLAFAGNLFMDAKLSQTVSGFKSFLLKAADPFFRRNGRTRVPLKVTGTREDPQFGLDLKRVFRR
ncbi:MAG: hypothetical protein AB7Q29_15535 [Vicinamibacterales bacterium]